MSDQKENTVDSSSSNQQQQSTSTTEEPYALSRFLSSSSSSKQDTKINSSTTSQQQPSFMNRYAVVPRLSSGGNNNTISSSANNSDSNLDDDCEEEITAEYLKSVTGFDELHLVSDAELQVNNKTQSVHLISSYLPNVVHLRLSRSTIHSIRELGTTFTSLRVLWLSASSVNNLNGIQHIGHHLRELFLAFNHIKDVSPLCVGTLKNLEVLDLEGNMIADGESAVKDLISVRNLPALKSLTLAGNPFISSNKKEDQEEEEDEDDDEDDYGHHLQIYHKLVLRRIKEVQQEMKDDKEESNNNDNENDENEKKNSRLPQLLEYLDDTPIEEIQAKVHFATNNNNNGNTSTTNEDNFDGYNNNNNSTQQKPQNEIEEEFASARRRLQSRRENENKRNDPFFRTMFDELSLLQNAIRSQLGKAGENLVAEETVRNTSRLTSRQRSLAPEEQRQRFRVATARGSGEGSRQSNTDNQEQTSKRPQPPASKNSNTTSKTPILPTPPSSERNSPNFDQNSNSRENSSDDPANSNSSNNTAVVGSLVHRLRSNKKIQQEQTGISPEKEKEEEEQLSMAEILSRKISNSASEKTRQMNAQRDPRHAARRRHEIEETDRLLDEIDAKYSNLENDGNEEDGRKNGEETQKPLFQSWLPSSHYRRHADPNKATDDGGVESSHSSVNSSTDDDNEFQPQHSRSHKDRMHQARKLLDLANKKKEDAEKKVIRRQEKKRNNNPNENDDDDSSDVSSCSSLTSSTYSTSSSSLSSSSSSYSSSYSSSRSSSRSSVDPNSKSASRTKRSYAPISDTEILQEVLHDKEIALVKLKKDIAGREGFLTAMSGSGKPDESKVGGPKFEAVDWQEGGEGTENTL